MSADEDFPFEKDFSELTDEEKLRLAGDAVERIEKIERDIAFIKARIEDQVDLMKQFINRFKGE